MDSTLEVDLGTTLNSTLNVSNATILASTLEVQNDASLNTALSIGGATTMDSTLEVDLGTTLSTLNVSNRLSCLHWKFKMMLRSTLLFPLEVLLLDSTLEVDLQPLVHFECTDALS